MIREIPPLMILAEESGNHQLFRFHGKRWALITFVLGFVLLAGTAYAHAVGKPGLLLLACLYGFAALLFYSTIYSLTADQWLLIDGRKRCVRFHKKNLYGKLDWQRSGDEFKEIRVFRDFQGDSRNMNWTIMLVAHDGLELFIGENEFGSLSREGALALAEKSGHLAGIAVTEK